MNEPDQVELFFEQVLGILRQGYTPAPKLIVKLRSFNGQFARLCSERGFMFDTNGTLIPTLPPEPPKCV